MRWSAYVRLHPGHDSPRTNAVGEEQTATVDRGIADDELLVYPYVCWRHEPVFHATSLLSDPALRGSRNLASRARYVTWFHTREPGAAAESGAV
jgi:hypothetical protein